MSYLTREAAAKELGVSVSTIDRWLDDPDIPIRRRKVGRGVRIDPAEVELYLTGKKPRSKRAATVIDHTA